jgi:hypothetical protein
MRKAYTHLAIFKKVAVVAATAILIVGGAFPATVGAQQNPTGWPEGAPPLSGTRLSGTPLNEAEVAYFRAQMSAGLIAIPRTITQEEVNAIEETLRLCAGSDLCNASTWTDLRGKYIDLVLANAGTPADDPFDFDLDDDNDPLDPFEDDPVVPGTDGTDTGTPATSAIGDIDPGDSCNFFGGGNLLTCIQSVGAKILASILWIFVSLFGWMLGIVGMFFNWVMLVTVFQYATYFGNSEGMLLAWSVLRDVGNIMLLFGFIFIGLQTILNIGHFSVGKALPRLVIFAILINFSLFISSAIVDVSNVFASSFYNFASEEGEENGCEPEDSAEECVGYGIAGKIMQASGVTAIFHAGGNFSEIITSDDGTKQFVLYAGLSIFLLVMMVTLGAAAIMFVIRAITLMFLLVISPLGIAAMAIPQFEEQSSKWWKMLISNAFFAPIYILLILVGLKIMEGAQATFNADGNTTLVQALSSSSVGAGGIFILFSLMIGFMIAAMLSAKSFGAIGASFAINTASKTVGAATIGTAGFVGRRTVGAGMASLGSRIERSDLAKRNPGLARMALGITDAASHASFDARQSGVVKGAAKAGGLDLGEPNKVAAHGIHGIHEKAEKERVAFEKRIKPSANQTRGARLAEKELEMRKQTMKSKTQTEEEDMRAKEKNLEKVLNNKKSTAIQVNTARAELERSIKTLNDAKAKVEITIDGKTTKLEQRIKDLEARKKNLDKRAKGDSTAELMHGYHAGAAPTGLGRVMHATAGPHADHEGYERLKKGGSMTDYEKALNTLKDEFEKGGKPAPTPPPADTGGAPADDHAHTH